MTLDDPHTRKIVDFLDGIGIPVTLGPVADDAFLPGIVVHDGGLRFDATQRHFPGDLLHEAGHVAVTAPELRATLSDVSDHPGEESAAIAWSYAAALHIGIDPELVFHNAGYRGNAMAMLDAFRAGSPVGVVVLMGWGMADFMTFPTMNRWLR